MDRDFDEREEKELRVRKLPIEQRARGGACTFLRMTMSLHHHV